MNGVSAVVLPRSLVSDFIPAVPAVLSPFFSNWRDLRLPYYD